MKIYWVAPLVLFLSVVLLIDFMSDLIYQYPMAIDPKTLVWLKRGIVTPPGRILFYDSDDRIFHGRVIGIADVIGIQPASLELM